MEARRRSEGALAQRVLPERQAARALDEAVAKARASGKFDYDAVIPGMRALDRYTLQLTLTKTDYTLMSYLEQTALVGRRARSRRGLRRRQHVGDGASGRHRRLPAEELAPRPEDRARGAIPAIARNISRRRRPDADAATRAIAASMKGKRVPQIGTIEISIIEEASPLLLAFESRTLDYFNVPVDLTASVIGADGKLLPAFAKARRHAAHDRAERARLHVLQHGRPGRRRLHARPHRAAPRDRDGIRRARPRQGDLQGPGAASRRRSCRRMPRATCRALDIHPATIPRPRARCSTTSATRTATATAFASCPTASR